MKLFQKNFLIFIFILSMIFLFAYFLPPTPKTNQSPLQVIIDKNNLLEKINSPRLILVGGSSASFGFNSELLKKFYKLDVINMGMHAKFGLKFHLDNVIRFIEEGDIVIVAPEYDQFFDKFAFGGEPLAKYLLDIDRFSYTDLNADQIFIVIKSMPKILLSKIFNPSEYFFKKSKVYSKDSYNYYGDATGHVNLKRKKNIAPYGPIKGKLNYDVFLMLEKFNNTIKDKGAECFISFPALQKSTFINQEDQIKQVISKLDISNLSIISNYEEYIFNDSLFYDTPYHLTSEGIKMRTHLLINDLVNN
tara:strand:+ start:1076 stop:1990 length:915 start_codon:yes stop_codon:yes gene_type:complete